MTEHSIETIEITKPGILALGTDLPSAATTAALFDDQAVTQISCGYSHSAVVLSSGRVYVFGKHEVEQYYTNISPPKLVTCLSHVKVVQAACGEQFTLFLTAQGQVYACGSNEFGQLGLGHTDDSTEPSLVNSPPCVKKIAVGNQHSMVLTESGEVWGTGRSFLGACGISSRSNNLLSFTRVPDLPCLITDITCGYGSSVLLTATGVVLITGCNLFGQLGLGEKQSEIKKFTPVFDSLHPVAAVSCGAFHTVCLLVDGSVWTWGSNDGHKLGHGVEDRNCPHPEPVVSLEGYTVSKVIGGVCHSAVVTSDGDVLLLGKGSLLDKEENISVPTLIKKSPELIVKQVAFASKYCLLLIGSKETEKPAAERLCIEKTLSKDTGITDVEEQIMKSLECPVCFMVMSSPTHLCSSGHSVCGGCRAATPHCSLCLQPYTNIRNFNLERLSTVTPLPCADCLERMPADRLEKHSEACPNRKYNCPLQQTCSWRGVPDNMYSHTSSSHPQQTWEHLPHTFNFNVSQGGESLTYLVRAHGQVFTLHLKYNNKFLAFARCIGPPENAELFVFKISLIKDGRCDKNIFFKNVCDSNRRTNLLYDSYSCMSVCKDTLASYLFEDKLMCEVDILKGESRNQNESIKTLLQTM